MQYNFVSISKLALQWKAFRTFFSNLRIPQQEIYKWNGFPATTRPIESLVRTGESAKLRERIFLLIGVNKFKQDNGVKQEKRVNKQDHVVAFLNSNYQKLLYYLVWFLFIY